MMESWSLAGGKTTITIKTKLADRSINLPAKKLYQSINPPVGTELVDDGVLVLGWGEGASDQGGEALLLALQDLPAVLQARHAGISCRQGTLNEKVCSVMEPEPDFLAGAGAGEKGSGSGLLLFGLGVLWWQSRQFL